ncbi:hypothetical protein LINPERHAP2_LOCUS13704 [Linum perenne]
MHPRRSRL